MQLSVRLLDHSGSPQAYALAITNSGKEHNIVIAWRKRSDSAVRFLRSSKLPRASPSRCQANYLQYPIL
jgi:hypothetical protein